MRKAALREWFGSVDPTDDMLKTVAPPALVADLVAADQHVIAAASTPYCFPALMYDGTSTGNETRRFATVVPIAMKRSRAWVTRSGQASGSGGAALPASTIETTTSGGIGGAAADKITTNPPLTGTAGYLDVGFTSPQTVVAILTGDDDTTTPAGAAKDRMVQLPEDKANAVEEFEVYLSDGFGLMPSERTSNLETL